MKTCKNFNIVDGQLTTKAKGSSFNPQKISKRYFTTFASVSLFLNKIMCRHDFVNVQMNEKSVEFVNNVIKKLLKMTGVRKRVTSAYHPEAKGFCERQD